MAAGDGLISMKPTSIVHAGTSASINADGGVDFTAVTSLSLNGVFTSSFDNYLVVISATNTSTQVNYDARLRSSGTDASGSNYTRQFLQATSTTVNGARATSQTSIVIGNADDNNNSGDNVHIYGPYLAQPTAFRSVGVQGESGAVIVDNAGTHSLSTSYDGITINQASGSMTGTIHVFGYEE